MTDRTLPTERWSRAHGLLFAQHEPVTLTVNTATPARADWDRAVDCLMVDLIVDRVYGLVTRAIPLYSDMAQALSVIYLNRARGLINSPGYAEDVDTDLRELIRALGDTFPDGQLIPCPETEAVEALRRALLIDDPDTPWYVLSQCIHLWGIPTASRRTAGIWWASERLAHYTHLSAEESSRGSGSESQA